MLDRSGDKYPFCGFNRDNRCIDQCCRQGDVVFYILPPVELFTHKEVCVWVSLYSVFIVSTRSLEAIVQLK